MKKALMILFVFFGIFWFREPIMNKLGLVKPVPEQQSYYIPQSNFIVPDPVKEETKPATCMSVKEFTELAKTDPNAYSKLINCSQEEQDHSAVDKLMNFFAHLKYE